MAKRGRPNIAVDERQLEQLAKIHCTDAEIAAVLGIDVDTLHANYSEKIAGYREHGKARLRLRLWRLAEQAGIEESRVETAEGKDGKSAVRVTKTTKSEVRALLLLAKNVLGMTEKTQTDVTSGGQPLAQIVISLPDNDREGA